MRYSLAQAAGATGRSRSTILRSIKAGRLSADRDELTQAWMMDASELHRLYPPLVNGQPVTPVHDQPRTSEMIELRSRLEAAETRIADARDQVNDLRARLDASEEERRQTSDRLAAAQERITALLTDQRPNGAVPVEPPRSAWGRFLAWRRR